MGYPELTVFCNQYLRPQNTFTELVNLTNLHSNSLTNFCGDVNRIEIEAEAESEYSEPMVLIGMYISVASIICILAMALDLFNGFRNKNFWFPTKYFPLNAASITVITVAMKLPVDMTSPMPGRLDQIGKFGSLTFMFTIMSNLMPSLASMDNKSLVSNIVALSILVITLSVNAIIQIRTHVIGLYDLVGCRSWFSFFVSVLMIILPYIYLCMLLFLLIIFISSAITIPTSKRILEIKYQAIRKTILVDQNQQQNHLISSVDELRLLVKKYWIMAETGSPQFVMASNPLSSACSVICVISLVLYIFAVLFLVLFQGGPYLSLTKTTSVYKWSMIAIVVTQFIGVFVGSIAPIFRCFTFLSFKSSIANKEKRNQILVFKVDKYWTQTLFEWKESRIISVLSSGRRSKALLHRLKNRILSEEDVVV
uniref:uncharacterized protein LOC122609166 n=1 Tax=Erigeron canadensis TaxID=72917 RepID=UPI001CB989CD|nr:uncharacterized protein LOC122609166 [Erigeron canadensis]